jgi:hypothetical protein
MDDGARWSPFHVYFWASIALTLAGLVAIVVLLIVHSVWVILPVVAILANSAARLIVLRVVKRRAKAKVRFSNGVDAA